MEPPLQAVVPAPPPLSTKPNFTSQSHNVRVNSTCTQTDEAEILLQSVVPRPPPLSTQPSFTRPSRYLRSKHTCKEESSQNDGSSAPTDGDVKKVESPLKSQSSTHPQKFPPAGHECPSVTVLESTHDPQTSAGSNTDFQPHAQSNPKATNSREVSAPGTNMVTKSELEKKLLEKLALFGQILQQEATHTGVNNSSRLNEVQKLASAIKGEMATTASASSTLVEDEQEEVSAPKTLTSGNDASTIPPQCSGSSKLNSVAQSNSTTDEVHVPEETSPNTPMDLERKSLSPIEEYIVELPAVTSPYSLHCGSVDSIDVSESNKSTESALLSLHELASAVSSAIISEVLSDRSMKEFRATHDSLVDDSNTSITVVGDEPAMPSFSTLTRVVASPASLAQRHTTAEVSAENTEPNNVSDLQNEPQSEDSECIVELPAVTSPYSLHCGTAENNDASQSNKSTDDLASAMTSASISEVLSDRSKKELNAAHDVNANDIKSSTAAADDKMKIFPSSTLAYASDVPPSTSLVQSQCKTPGLDTMAGSVSTTAEGSTENTDPNDAGDLQDEPLSTDDEYIVVLPAVTSPYSLHCGTAENVDALQSNKSTESGPSDVQELAAAVSSSIVSDVLSDQSMKDNRTAEGGNVINTNISTAITGDEMTNSTTIIGDIPPPACLKDVDLNVSSTVTPSSAMAGQELATDGCSSTDCAVSLSASQKSKAISKASIKAQSTESSVTIFSVASKKEMDEPLPSGEMATSRPMNEAELTPNVSVCTSKKSDMNVSSTETNGDIDTNVAVDGAANTMEYQDTEMPYPLTTVTSSNIDTAESSGSTGSTITVLLSAESNVSRVTVVLTAPSNECLSNASDLMSCSDAEATAHGLADASTNSTFEKVTTSAATADANVGAVVNSRNCGDDTQALRIGSDLEAYGTEGNGEGHATQSSASAPATNETGVLTESGEDATQTVATATGMGSDSFGVSTKEIGDETPAIASAKSAEETSASDSGNAGDDTTQTVTSPENCSAEMSTTSNVVTSAMTDTNDLRKHTNTSTTVDTDNGAHGINGGENSTEDDALTNVIVETGALTSSCSHGQQNADCSNCCSGEKTATSDGDVGESNTSELKGEPKSDSVSNQKICNTTSTASRISATNSVGTKSSGARKCQTSSSAAIVASVNGTKMTTESATSLQASAELRVANSKEKSVETKTKSTSVIKSASGTGSTVPTKSSRQRFHAGMRKTESDPSGSNLPSQVLKESKCKSLASFRTSDMEEAVKPNKKRSRAAELGLTRPKSKPNMIPVGHKKSDPNMTTAAHRKSDSLVLPKLSCSSKNSEESQARAVIKSSKETISDRQSVKTVTHSQSNTCRSHSRSSHEMKQRDISLPKLCTKTEHGGISDTTCSAEPQTSEDKLIHSPSTHSRGSTEKSASHGPAKRASSSRNLEGAAAPTDSNTRVATSTRSSTKYSKTVQKANSSSGRSALPSDNLKKSKYSKSLASFRTSDMEQAAYPKERRSRAAELGLIRAKSGPNMIPRGRKSSDSSHFQKMVSPKKCSKDSCGECKEKPEARTSTTAVKIRSGKTAAGSKSAKTVTQSRSDGSHCRPSQSMKQKSKSFPEQRTHVTE